MNNGKSKQKISLPILDAKLRASPLPDNK